MFSVQICFLERRNSVPFDLFTVFTQAAEKEPIAQHREDSSCWLHCAPANHKWSLVYVSVPSPSGGNWSWASAKVVSGRTSRAFLSPRRPIKSCSTAPMLYRHFGFQEIISDWEGQHPVGLGEPLIVLVWLPVLCIVCLSVLASADASQTRSLDGKTHHSHGPQESTVVS